MRSEGGPMSSEPTRHAPEKRNVRNRRETPFETQKDRVRIHLMVFRDVFRASIQLQARAT